VNQQPVAVAAVKPPQVSPRPKVALETSTTAASIDKLHTEISALAEAMKNIPIIVQN